MKKLLAFVLTGALALSAFAQGQVQFQNRNTAAGIDAPIYWYSLFGGGKLDGADPLLRAALLGGPTSGTPASKVRRDAEHNSEPEQPGADVGRVQDRARRWLRQRGQRRGSRHSWC